MADVAVISVVSSGVVGLLGAASGIYAQRVTLRNERAKRLESRREHLRTVLSEAATVAMDAEPSTGAPEQSVRALALLVDAQAGPLSQQLARIGVLLGPDSQVFTTYEQIRHCAAVLELVLSQMPPEVTSGDLLNRSGEPEIKPHFDRMDEHAQALRAAVSSFLSAANAQLEEPRS